MALKKSYGLELSTVFQGERYRLKRGMANLLGSAFSVLTNEGGEKNLGKTLGILLCLHYEGRITDNDYEELAGFAKRIFDTRTSGQAHAEVMTWIKTNE